MALAESIFDDIAAHPKIWTSDVVPGSDPPTDPLIGRLAVGSVQVPQDLLHFWSVFGAGTLFETEEIYAPWSSLSELSSRVGALFERSLLPLHSGLSVTGLDPVDGVIVVVSGLARGHRFDSLDAWYRSVPREEFAGRYLA